MRSEYPVLVTMDLNEGRYLDLGCLSCKSDVRATLAVAHPLRMYLAAMDCDECGEQLIEFDVFMGVNRTWRAA